jgi:magnesium transporter
MAEWIDLLDPSEEKLRKALPEAIHDRALEQLLRPARHDDEPRPRLEGQVHYIFGVLLVPVAIREEDRVFYQEVDVVATRARVVTVRKTPERGYPFDCTPVLDAVAKEADDRAGVIVYRLLDQIAEYYLDLVDALDDEIDELEDGIETWPPAQVRQRISDLRHDLLHVRRTVAPTRDAVRRVVDRRIDVGHGPEVMPRDIELDFADVYDKLLRASDGLDLSRDLLSSARDYQQAKIANDQNEVMKAVDRDRGPVAPAHVHRRPLRPELPPHPGAALGLRLLVELGPDHRDDDRAARDLPRDGLDRRRADEPSQAAAAADARPAIPGRSAAAPHVATIAACRTSSARTARTARSTTTGWKA